MVDHDGLEALRHRGELLFLQAIERMERIRANGHHPMTGPEADRAREKLLDLRRTIHVEAVLAGEARS